MNVACRALLVLLPLLTACAADERVTSEASARGHWVEARDAARDERPAPAADLEVTPYEAPTPLDVAEPGQIVATAEQSTSAAARESRSITATAEQVPPGERAPLAVTTLAPHTGPRPEDVESLDAIVRAAYDTISGLAGVPRDWERFHALFHPELGRLVPIQRSSDGRRVPLPLTPAGYVERSAPAFESQPIFEREVARRVVRFGGLAQVASTYVLAGSPDPVAEPLMRGLNSFELLDDGERWWILSISWQAEEPGLTLPDELLRDG